MTTALVFHLSVLQLPLWLDLLSLGIACFGIVAILRWSELRELWSRHGDPRVLIIALLVAVAFVAKPRAVYWTQYWPCTEANWAWLLDNMHEWLALTVWYGAYGCF
jgi:hypothetical protein